MQTTHINSDNLKSLLHTEMLRYKSAIGKDFPFGEVKKIKKQINELKLLLAQQEQSIVSHESC